MVATEKVSAENNSVDMEHSPDAEQESSSSISHTQTYTIGSYTLPQIRSGSGHSALAHRQNLNAPPLSGRSRSGSVRSTRSARSASASVTVPPRSHLPSHLVYGNAPHSPASHVTSFAQQSSNTHISLASNGVAASSTHAGGILPSASFFHPSRPSFHANSLARPRPASVGSDLSSNVAQTSFSEEPYARNPQTATTLTKVSREPLLPIGGGPSSRPKPTHQAQASMGGAGASTSGRVRTSLEKFLRRTLSVDTTSKPTKSLHSELAAQEADGEKRPHVAINIDSYIDFNSGKYDDDDVIGSPVSAHASRLRSKPSFRAPGSINLHRIPSRARFDKFNPNPPVRKEGEPNLAEVPVKKSGKVRRRWQEYPSRNAFFLNGRLLTGGDSPAPFIGTLTLVFGIAGSWLGTTCVWWWHNESPAVAIVGAYMTLLVIVNMLATVGYDKTFREVHLIKTDTVLICLSSLFAQSSRHSVILASYHGTWTLIRLIPTTQHLPMTERRCLSRGT
jgi:palmitoyltransferase ZDHHC9/14/18